MKLLDLNDQLSGALVLGEVNRTLAMSEAIDAATDVDMFSFTVMAGQRISFDIDQTVGSDSYIRLFSANGVELAANNNATGPGEANSADSYLECTFTSGGTFSVGISGFSNTNYHALSGSGDLNGSGSYALPAKLEIIPRHLPCQPTGKGRHTPARFCCLNSGAFVTIR